MSEESQFLPFDTDANDRPMPTVLGDPPPFRYVGLPLRADEIAAYLQTVQWLAKKPTFIVLHHTAIPSASWGRWPTGEVWDAGEAGWSIGDIRAKRARQLAGLRDYYNTQLLWDRGPHFFIDDEWAWVFSPLNEEGIHARAGNRDKDGNGYSIGIEVVGYFEHNRWPFAVEHNVVALVTALKNHLGTFEYTDQMWAGGISAHRNYGKPACPGEAIQPSYYIPLFKGADSMKSTQAGTAAPVSTAQPTVDQRFKVAYDQSGGVWKPGALTPGYPTAPAVIGPDGLVRQRFERGVARLNKDNSVSWLLLSEIATLP